MDINGHSVVISGGATGLGAATAVRLAELGARITLLDINETSLNETAEKIGAQAIVCDVSQAAAVEAAFATIAATQGLVRIAIQCAGIAPAQRIIGKQGPMPLADFNQVIAVNLIGTFNIMRIAAAQMSLQQPLNDDQEQGVIINTASIAAEEGQIGQAAYSASKGGIKALTLPAARELARFGIRVVAISPGLFATPLLQAMPDSVQNQLAASIPFPSRFGKAQEYARLCCHIIDNPMLNGTVIRLDGALRMSA